MPRHRIPNRYENRGDVTAMYMRATGGSIVEVLIDTEDVDRVSQYTWHMQMHGRTPGRIYDPDQVLQLHKFVVESPPLATVKARNGNYSDCRKSNLRRCDVQEYEIRGDTTALIMYRNDGSTVESLIDTADLAIALSSPMPWHVDQRGRVTNGDGRRRVDYGTTHLHRYLMQPPDGLVVDHINGNSLDNRRANLRIVTQAQNMQNMRLSRVNTSGERGISWCKQMGKWQANIWSGGRLLYLGRYDDYGDAVRVVREARAKHMPFSKEARELQMSSVK